MKQTNPPATTLPVDWRALCKALMDAIDDGIPAERIKQSPMAVLYDAAMAQPEPEAPTDQELLRLYQRNPMTDFRALCTELLLFAEQAGDIAHCEGLWPKCDQGPDWLLDRARAALAQPEPEEPTDEELLRLAREWNSGYESIEFEFIEDYAREVLARWGR